MTSLQFELNYKHDEMKRLAFNQLALDTFSIDFNSWFERGMWNDNYIPYSYFDGNQCVANASYNPMTLIIDGKETKGIQIGTVMTHPSFRGKGLAQKLIEKIINDTKASCELYFLCAEDAASSLYTRCGFHYRQENSYHIDLKDYETLERPLKPVRLSPQEFEKIKLESIPLSPQLSVLDDVHVALFYYHLGFDQMIYSPKDGIYVIFDIQESTLLLYSVYARDRIHLEDLIPLITPKEVEKVTCLFTPDKSTKGLNISPGNNDWMVRPNPKTLPDGYKFPLISRT